ncbi:histidine kinase [Geothrix sp. PMB-07]|uniref:histidine kinase n=1 Tax=Geothrix sp. PMB-07 TaxID=3068640 RepID=UPI002741CD61|nr:sensor histidine kinase [Geothrix sp. PMB-07]WLT30048.1 histidine kinase [Geothrix sp. PMB-07]
MRLPAVRSALHARLRHPGWWSMAIVLSTFPCLFMVLAPGPHTGRFYLGALWTIPVLNVGLFLSPLPWQWSADERLMTGWGRGLLQVLVFALAMGALLAPMGWFTNHATPKESFSLGAILGLSLPFLLLLGPAGWIIARAERLAREARDAQAKARESLWMSHRGAFSPRLLFSNLNQLALTAGQDTRSAEQGLLDLAALYRRWLMEAELPLIPLATERSLTEQYLALERKRWGDSLNLRWRLAPDLDAFLVPPLLLQPLLESALEHPTETRLDMDLEEQSLPPGQLSLRLQVRGPAPMPSDAQLHPIRRRLQALLGREAQLSLVSVQGGWDIQLQLPAMPGEAKP